MYSIMRSVVGHNTHYAYYLYYVPILYLLCLLCSWYWLILKFMLCLLFSLLCLLCLLCSLLEEWNNYKHPVFAKMLWTLDSPGKFLGYLRFLQFPQICSGFLSANLGCLKSPVPVQFKLFNKYRLHIEHNENKNIIGMINIIQYSWCEQ